MDRKYQIFISSTYKDLIEQRDQVVKTVLRLGHLPVGMEMFNAADQAQWEVIKRHIDNSDYYVVILAHRYGSLDDDGTGFTEKEYDYAVSKGIPCMAFVIDDKASWPHDLSDVGELKEKLKLFKEKARKRLVNHWSSTENLENHVLFALTEAFNINPRVGWVRANETSASPQVLEEMSRLSKENNELKSALAARGEAKDEIMEAQDILKKSQHEVFDLNSASQTGPTYKANELEIIKNIGKDLTHPVHHMEVAYLVSNALTKRPKSNANHSRILLDAARDIIQDFAILGLIDTTVDAKGSMAWVLSLKGKALLVSLKDQA